MDKSSAIISVILIYSIINVRCFSLYSWTQTGEKYCTGNATKEQTGALLKCDKLMRQERKNLLETCLKEMVNIKLTDEIPRICSYFNNEKDFKVMDCMFNKTFATYGSMFKATKDDLDVDEIDAVENDFDWCVMKSGSLYGFEHLCDMQLNDTQINVMKSCKNNAKEIIEVLDKCRTEAKLKNDKRPSLCDYFENITVKKCWIRNTSKWDEGEKNDKRNNYIVRYFPND